MPRKYIFHAQVIFTVPDDKEPMCDEETADAGGAIQETACGNYCGGEDDQYFWGRLKAFLANEIKHDDAQVYSTEIERYYDEGNV